MKYVYLGHVSIPVWLVKEFNLQPYRKASQTQPSKRKEKATPENLVASSERLFKTKDKERRRKLDMRILQKTDTRMGPLRSSASSASRKTTGTKTGRI